MTAPHDQIVEMTRSEDGYFSLVLPGIPAGTRYYYRIDDDRERPDPASRFQPQGVHGPSEVIGSEYEWHDAAWTGLPLEDYIIYELHVGTFTPEGTFDAIIPRLGELRDLGITALEIMPISQFPGSRNWGYDGTYPFAVQNSYGGPDALRRLVDACHHHGIAAILDVVYNHLGPEGNYLGEFGYYFTDQYKTPWGSAINFDQPWCDHVRHYFVESARYWIHEFHFDALRLDAVHAIHDFSAHPFLRELREMLEADERFLSRPIHLIAESDLNDTRIIRPRCEGGFQFHAQWSDDFHHALHTMLTGESRGYYASFGELAQLATCLREGWCYSGQFSPARNRRHGDSPADRPARQFIVCSQNHDQVGNRQLGERLISLTDFASAKLAAATILLSPYVPLLFMGEEYAESSPFQYFVSHGDSNLIEAVRRGRAEEFAQFADETETPDPQGELTFRKSGLAWNSRGNDRHAKMLAWYRDLIRARREIPALSHLDKQSISVTEFPHEKSLLIERWHNDSRVAILLNFSDRAETLNLRLLPKGSRIILDSEIGAYGGSGSSAPQARPRRSAMLLQITN